MNGEKEKGEMGHELLKIVMEFSKRIIATLLGMYAIQLLATQVMIVLMNEDVATRLIQLMEVCMPLYHTGIIGYNAKAALENVQKIRATYEAATEKKEGNG